MKKFTIWQLVVALFLTFSLNATGQEMLLNGNLESWIDATHPTGWTKAENIDKESVPANVHGGSYSAKHTGGTKDLGQTILGIIPGDSYTISFWYKVVANDNSDSRIWSYWKNADGNISANGNELRGPNNGYLNNNGGVWTLYTTTIDAPETADRLYFEVRTYGGAITYWDDMSVMHNTTGSVEAPTFTPVAGTYYEAQTVSMSIAEKDGPKIYYTTNGTIPDNGSFLYSAPITISSTTTLKAITFDGEASSGVTTGVYTIETPVPAATIADLRAYANNKDNPLFILSNEVILTFQQGYRDQKYIEDATGAILIDDNSGNITTSYAIGDGITGIIGTLGSYKGMLQFKPVTDPGTATSVGNPLIPTVVSAAAFVANFEDYEAMLVRVNGLTFDDAGVNFATGQVYNTVDGGANNLEFRTSFYAADYITTAIPAGVQDIIGIANDRDAPFLTARFTADIIAAGAPPAVPLGSTGIMIAGFLIAGIIIVRKGKLF
ncbi:MAG: chitobiase/beta-hexosaminidase C-terminal domain-containing protein [Bacteroidales bacterium]|nr:chitobiase/beta-hexosaminidase C-terminal domain-containing protein [Bacteroidales bacterium]